MADARAYFEIACRHCGGAESCDLAEIERRLRGTGMLRRNAKPSAEELTELLRSAAAAWRCPQCGAAGLIVDEAPDEDAAWPDARRCVVCGDVIPAERLEIFPHAERCARCQGCQERGEPSGEVEYCPRCGAPMVLRQSTGAGITRYVMTCSSGSRCRGR